jgi:hypothetical protein
VSQMVHMGPMGQDLGLQQLMSLQQLHYIGQLLPTGCGAGRHLARDEWSLHSHSAGSL